MVHIKFIFLIIFIILLIIISFKYLSSIKIHYIFKSTIFAFLLTILLDLIINYVWLISNTNELYLSLKQAKKSFFAAIWVIFMLYFEKKLNRKYNKSN